jgi:iron complex outermembrane receptor protein
VVVRLDGNEEFDSEELVSWEAGYRAQLLPAVSADLSVYYGWYDRLRSIRMLAPTSDGESVVQPITLGNDLRGHAYGGTLAANWHPRRTLRFHGSYTLLQTDVSPRDDAPAGSAPGVNPGFNPTHQAHLRTSVTLPNEVELDLAFRYVGELEDPRISDYAEADVRLGWSVRPGLILAVAGRDLLHSRHPEFSSLPQRELQRRGELQLEWRF